MRSFKIFKIFKISHHRTAVYFIAHLTNLLTTQAFDILNINRMTSGIDTYGQGRCPFFLETSVIVLITDGGKLTTGNLHSFNR